MSFSAFKPWSLYIHRWVRGEFPNREYCSEFDVVAPSSQFAKPSYRLSAFFRVCSKARSQHALLLRIIGEHLTALNRYPANTVIRWLHVWAAERFARPVIGIIYTAYSPRDENPEPDERKELTRLAIEAIQQITVSYELILQKLQQLPNRTYAMCHHKVLCIGHRLMELMQAEQHLSSLRRMKLSERAWKNCNQLFFALRECEDLNTKLPLAGYLHGPVRAAWQPKAHDEPPTHESTQQLYIAIQVTGMIEPASWASPQFSWIQSYLRRTLPRLKLRDYIPDTASEESISIARTQNRAPTFVKPDTGLEHLLTLDLGPLLRRVTRDVERLAGGHLDTRSGVRARNVSRITLQEQGQLLERLLQKLRYHADRDARQYVNQYVDLSMYWGFGDVFGVVKDFLRTEGSWEFDAMSLSEQLAHQSSNLADDSGVLQQTKQWYLLNESDGGMQFRFQETRYTKPLFIGQLVAYSRQTEEMHRTTPHLAYVNRMQRARSGELEITVQKLANEAECVGVQDANLQQSGHALPALMIHCRDGKWRLLMHSRQGSYALSKLFLRADGQTQPLQLGRMFLYQPEFVVFDIVNYEHV